MSLAVIILLAILAFRIGYWLFKSEFQQIGGLCWFCQRNSEEEDDEQSCFEEDPTTYAPPPVYEQCVTPSQTRRFQQESADHQYNSALPDPGLPSYDSVKKDNYVQITHPINSEMQKLRKFSEQRNKDPEYAGADNYYPRETHRELMPVIEYCNESEFYQYTNTSNGIPDEIANLPIVMPECNSINVIPDSSNQNFLSDANMSNSIPDAAYISALIANSSTSTLSDDILNIPDVIFNVPGGISYASDSTGSETTSNITDGILTEPDVNFYQPVSTSSCIFPPDDSIGSNRSFHMNSQNDTDFSSMEELSNSIQTNSISIPHLDGYTRSTHELYQLENLQFGETNYGFDESEA